MPRSEARHILHVGYPKCASTFLQRSFLGHHPQVDLATAANSPLVPVLLNRRESRYDPEEVRALFQGPQAVKVLSCEVLVGGSIFNWMLGDFYARRLKETFPSARVMLMIRNQEKAIESMFLQWVRGGGGGRMGVNDFLATERLNRGRMGFNWEYYDYARTIGWYQRLFGRDRVKVYLFEELARDAGAFLDHLCADLDLAPLPEADMTPRKVGLSPYSYAFMRMVNRYSFGWFNMKGGWLDRFMGDGMWVARTRNRLTSLYSRFPLMGRHYRFLSKASRERIRDHYREPNQRLKELTGLPLEQHGYPL